MRLAGMPLKNPRGLAPAAPGTGGGGGKAPTGTLWEAPVTVPVEGRLGEAEAGAAAMREGLTVAARMPKAMTGLRMLGCRREVSERIKRD